MMIASTAAALAPVVMPTISGLASGLRRMVWKITPESPNAAPERSPAITRGRRTPSTMKSFAASALPVNGESSEAITSASGKG